MAPKHLTSIRDLTAQDVAEVFKLSASIKSAPEKYRGTLAGKSLALIFQTPSTGTRVSFQVEMHQLGGQALMLSATDLEATGGVSAVDTAKALSQYVDGIVARTQTHAELVELSRNADVPVVNGLTDLLHWWACISTSSPIATLPPRSCCVSRIGWAETSASARSLTCPNCPWSAVDAIRRILKGEKLVSGLKSPSKSSRTAPGTMATSTRCSAP